MLPLESHFLRRRRLCRFIFFGFGASKPIFRLVTNHFLRRRRLCRFIFLGFGASKIICCSSSARKTFSVVEGPFEVRHFSVSPDSALGIGGKATRYAFSPLTPLCGFGSRYTLCRTHLPWRQTLFLLAFDALSSSSTKQKMRCYCGNG